jgi:hypothetical protein
MKCAINVKPKINIIEDNDYNVDHLNNPKR